MQSLGAFSNVDLQTEAAVATFIYDALLREKGQLSHKVVAAAAAFPNAAAIAESRISGTPYVPKHARGFVDQGPVERIVTVARLSVVPCAHAAGRLSIIVVRIVLFLAAVLTSAAIIAFFYSAQGAAAVYRVSYEVFGVDEKQIYAAIEHFSDPATGANKAITHVLIEIERIVSGLRLVQALPEEYASWALLTIFFFIGAFGGLLVVQSAIAICYVGGFAAGFVMCKTINLALLLTGGLNCHVTRRRATRPNANIRGSYRS
jgi:hypothetical protein